MRDRSSDGGQLVVVGCGLQPSRHASPRTISEIQRADVVFALAEPFALHWLGSYHPEVRNLSEHYADDRDRRESYRAMEEAILEPVRAGRRVCVVLYGHPGVFAQIGHRTIEQARLEGIEAAMEPGISAEACLYADLGIDPGTWGVQSIEATGFLIEQRVLDPASLVLIWQVALAGNLECVGFHPQPDRLRLLVKKLEQWYSSETRVILYEAATLPILPFRAEQLSLADLPEARYEEYTTLVIPPPARASRDEVFWTALSEHDNKEPIRPVPAEFLPG